MQTVHRGGLGRVAAQQTVCVRVGGKRVNYMCGCACRGEEGELCGVCVYRGGELCVGVCV